MSEFSVMTMEKIVAVAEALGCDVVVAKDNELQFDLDNDEALKTFSDFYNGKLHSRFGDKLPRQHWKSKSGNDHWTITLPKPMDVVERIALQAIGGSDAGREFAALNCHNAGSPHPILLFQPKTPSVKLLGAGESQA